MRALALLALLLPLALVPLAASDDFPSRPAEGVYLSPEGVPVPADVAWEGPCNGEGVLTVTALFPEGDRVWTVPAQSAMTLDACEMIGPSCFECPPAPAGVAWTLEGEGVSLAGGGVAYVWDTDSHSVAWSMQGPFLGGWLEFRGLVG